MNKEFIRGIFKLLLLLNVLFFCTLKTIKINTYEKNMIYRIDNQLWKLFIKKDSFRKMKIKIGKYITYKYKTELNQAFVVNLIEFDEYYYVILKNIKIINNQNNIEISYFVENIEYFEAIFRITRDNKKSLDK